MCANNFIFLLFNISLVFNLTADLDQRLPESSCNSVFSHGSRKIKVVVEDRGNGIEDVEEAMQPMYTSKPELERSGMGFSFMESFMDSLEVVSIKGEGTKVVMTKTIELPK